VNNKKIPSRIQIDSELCKRSFYHFVKKAWFIVEPATEFVDNWHIKLICEYLEACVRGEVRNLIINIPPRHMKSLLVNVFFPAWVWTFAPEKKFLFSSYAEDIAIRDSVNCRKIIQSDWYRLRWKMELSSSQNQKSKFENTKSGYRLSIGVGGGATGEGGDFIVVDDPIKAKDAYSDSIRDGVNEWWSNTMSTRLNNPKTGVRIVIMQRLHENDLTGYLLKGKEKYEHVVLPAEYEGVRYQSSINLNDPRKTDGELLWPDRFGEKELQSLKASLSERGVASQLQQRPSPIAGNIFKREWFSNRYAIEKPVATFISWDTALSDSENAAYSSCVVGQLSSDYRLFIKEVYRGKLQFPQLKLTVEDFARKYKDTLYGVIIENKVSGISINQTLQQSTEDWLKSLIIPFKPTLSKEGRAINCSLWCENQSVVLPPPSEKTEWLFDFENELFNFPNSDYKDQTDAFTQLVHYLENYLAEGMKYRTGVN